MTDQDFYEFQSALIEARDALEKFPKSPEKNKVSLLLDDAEEIGSQAWLTATTDVEAAS